MKKYPLTIFSIITVLLFFSYLDKSFKTWKRNEGVIVQDIHHYYGYLPATFIFNDLKIEKKNYSYKDKAQMFWTVKTEEGNNVFRMSMGLAMLYAPFFFTAHQYALLADYEANGFSTPYHVALIISSLFYLAIGLIFTAKALTRLKFTDTTVAITILSLSLATNLLCYSTLEAPMPHVYNFCLFAVFLYFTLKWESDKSVLMVIILSLLFGLIALIRPSNVVIIVFFLAYWLKVNTAPFDPKFLLKSALLASLTIFLVWLPQFLYWKYVTGHYLFYSYMDNGFNFDNPQILNGLFSFRKGWLIYTPLMFFSLIGIYYLKAGLKKFQLPIVLFLSINIYIIFSWWCWWYGGSFGSRPMIESYALLAIPLAAFTDTLLKKKWYVKTFFASLLLFFIWLNMFQTIQYKNGSLHWDSMTRELYFKQFGKRYQIPGYEDYLDYPILK